MKPRKIQHNKRMSRERRKSIGHEKSWDEYVKFMNANLEKTKNYHESPHIVICRSLHLIMDNSIILKTDSVVDEASLLRKIFYSIDRIGKNVQIKMKNPKYRNININDTAGRRIYILVNLSYVKDIPYMIFFNEFGRRLDYKELGGKKKAYVLLAMAEKNEIVKKDEFTVSRADIQVAKKLWVNQLQKEGSFHFDTTGRIYGLGYGPKYSIDKKTNLSIGQFASKKKKKTDLEEKEEDILKKKIFNFLQTSIEQIFLRFDGFQRNISPNISKLQIHFDLFDRDNDIEMGLQKKGILNAHLCLNAQTKLKHTECDSSYTTICVPPHEMEKTVTGTYNKAEFEFNINDDEAVVLPLEVGTIIVYSGFMLTHRQQIRRFDDDVLPFINVVSYNSKKMFNHLMESFRREIKMDSKRKLK